MVAEGNVIRDPGETAEEIVAGTKVTIETASLYVFRKTHSRVMAFSKFTNFYFILFVFFFFIIPSYLIFSSRSTYFLTVCIITTLPFKGFVYDIVLKDGATFRHSDSAHTYTYTLLPFLSPH